MVNFGPLAAEIVSLVWGTPGNFNGFRVLAALLHGTLVVGISQTAALNRGRHLYSTGLPSRWALTHISSSECNGFVAVRFGIKGVICKENRSNTLRTSRVHGPRPCTRHVHGRLHGPTQLVRGHVHGPFTPCTQPCTHAYVYTAVTRPCTRHIHGRVHGQYTAVYTGHGHGPYMAL